MAKLFRYELRRLVFSRFFLGLLTVLLWYGWQLLNTVTILGVAYTAPFSPWSFGAYLAGLGPFLSAALLFFLWNQRGEKARGVALLTAATPVEPGRYLLIKTAAAASAWLLLALSACALGLGFLVSLFGGDPTYAALAAPAAAALLPPLIFPLGLGLWISRRSPALLLPLMAAVIGLGFITPPLAADLYGRALFSQYPLTLGVLDPAFTMPAAAVWSRLGTLSLGGVLLWMTVRRQSRGQ